MRTIRGRISIEALIDGDDRWLGGIKPEPRHHEQFFSVSTRDSGWFVKVHEITSKTWGAIRDEVDRQMLPKPRFTLATMFGAVDKLTGPAKEARE